MLVCLHGNANVPLCTTYIISLKGKYASFASNSRKLRQLTAREDKEISYLLKQAGYAIVFRISWNYVPQTIRRKMKVEKSSVRAKIRGKLKQ